MTDKRAFAYFDDSKAVVENFKKAVRQVWYLPHDVLSNSKFGKIDDSSYEAFEIEICSVIEGNLDRLECVFLDLDFSGNIEDAQDDVARELVGFLLGRTIRRRWPQLPVIIVSRFTEKEIYRKGLIFDFDDICEGIALTQMKLPEFNGMLDLAKKKRQNIIESFNDIPVSFLTAKNKYFRRTTIKTGGGKFAFVAMSFDTKVVSNDVWELGIKGALEQISIEAIRADFDLTSKPIVDKLATYIFDSAFVIADITGWNANVMYELGLAHASNKDCILVYNPGAVGSLPFDVRNIRAIKYDPSSLTAFKTDLLLAVRDVLDSKVL